MTITLRPIINAGIEVITCPIGVLRDGERLNWFADCYMACPSHKGVQYASKPPAADDFGSVKCRNSRGNG
jgi:hypothetical protein